MLERRSYINSVNDFISQSKSSFKEILDVLGWQKPLNTSNDFKKEKNVLCPYDNSHRIPENSLEKHVTKCVLRRNGYSLDDIFLPPAADSGCNVLTIDEELQNVILKRARERSSTSAETRETNYQQCHRPVPQTSDRLFSDYTTEERLNIYDFAVQFTSSNVETLDKDLNLSFVKKENSNPKTLEELLAAERDAKRRSMKYKSTKVHTNRKTQTEILREVIESQMEGYKEWLIQQGNQPLLQSIKSEPDQAFDKSTDITDEKDHIKAITRKWEDWYYIYKGNPHKRYIKILKEERDAERDKASNKKLARRSRSISRDVREHYKGDDKKSRVKDEDYYRNRQRRNSREHDKRSSDYNTEMKRSFDDIKDTYRKKYEKSKSKHHKKKREYSDDEDYARYRKHKHKHKKKHKSEKHKSSKDHYTASSGKESETRDISKHQAYKSTLQT